MPIDSLQPREDNPRRKVPQAKIEQLARMLTADPEFMRARPIVAAPDGRIIAGAQRWRAAKYLGWKRLHAVHLDGDARLQAERMVRDNAHIGEWDEATLQALIAKHDVDPATTGLTADEIAALMASVPDYQPDTKPQARLDVSVERTCPKCGYAWRESGYGHEAT